MIRHALESYPHGLLTAFALVLFLSVFLGMLFWVFRRGGNEFYVRMAALPLESELGSVTERSTT